MKASLLKARPPFGGIRGVVALLCAVLLLPGDLVVYAQSTPSKIHRRSKPRQKIPNDQLSSGNYSARVVVGAAQRPKDKALVDAVEKEDWDPSNQAMAPLPDVVKQLAENIKWTTDLGNACLAQQNPESLH